MAKKYLNREKELIAFGEHLKSLREEKGFSMKELADTCGIEHSQISKYERGMQNPGLSQMLTIAEALEIHPMELLNF